MSYGDYSFLKGVISDTALSNGITEYEEHQVVYDVFEYLQGTYTSAELDDVEDALSRADVSALEFIKDHGEDSLIFRVLTDIIGAI